jgi:hypothetical protein
VITGAGLRRCNEQQPRAAPWVLSRESVEVEGKEWGGVWAEWVRGWVFIGQGGQGTGDGRRLRPIPRGGQWQRAGGSRGGVRALEASGKDTRRRASSRGEGGCRGVGRQADARACVVPRGRVSRVCTFVARVSGGLCGWPLGRVGGERGSPGSPKGGGVRARMRWAWVVGVAPSAGHERGSWPPQTIGQAPKKKRGRGRRGGCPLGFAKEREREGMRGHGNKREKRGR